MARTYTSAARRAAATPAPVDDPQGLLTWVDGNTTRARQALRQLEETPVDPADTAAVAARQQLVDALLDVFPSFVLDGERFRVLGEMQLLDLCELMRLNRRNVKTVDPAGVAALADFFQGALGPDEYERFREFCRVNCVDQDTLNDIMEGIVEDLAEVPTSRPSRSAPGPLTAGLTSKVVSMSSGTVRAEPMPPEDFQAFLARRQEQTSVGPLGTPAPEQTREFVSYG